MSDETSRQRAKTRGSTLTEFLLARIAEDVERVDRIPDWYCTNSARGEGWGSRGNCLLCDKYMFDGTEDVTGEAFWEHMKDTHRRASALAECEAKRRIVELHALFRTWRGDYACIQCFDREAPDEDFGFYPCPTLRLLALPYVDHPDWREEWRA